MYKLLLTFRYLRRKLIPLFAMLAVILCTAMVIIVMSVMGGFLGLVRDAGRTLMGDVSIHGGLGGFGHYEQIITELEKQPEVDAATPVIIAGGLLKLPGDVIELVQVYGIRGQGQDAVTAYRDTLFWTPEKMAEHLPADVYPEHDPIEAALRMDNPWVPADEESAAGSGDDGAEQPPPIPAVVPGIEVGPYNQRLDDGSYLPAPMIGRELLLSVLPVTQQQGTIEPASQHFTVVNEFKSGIYDVDSRRVFIPFDVAQRMMAMEAAPEYVQNPDGTPKLDPETGEPILKPGTGTGRTTEIHISAAPGVSPDELRPVVGRAYNSVARQHADLPLWDPQWTGPISIETWEQRQSMFLQAVENEKRLMTVLFGIISLTAVVMVGVIFYMIVLEKTRDIGILRALGASKPGVAAIFLSFGGAIGVLGSLLGTGVAFLMVHYINAIHNWLGDGLGFSAFTIGIPVGAFTLISLIAAAGVVIRSLFDLSRFRAAAAMAATGAALALAALAFYFYFVLWGRAEAPTTVGWGYWLAVIIAAALAFTVVSGVHLAFDAALPRSQRVTVFGLGGLAALISGLFVAGTTLAVDGLPDRLNRLLSVQIWDRSIYFFDRIPNQVDWFEVSVVVIIAIVASAAGALVPAVIAGLADPIESLRYE